jgi:hypothetical protein
LIVRSGTGIFLKSEMVVADREIVIPRNGKRI